MIDHLWKTVGRVVTIVAAVLAFLLAIELIHAYQTLRDVHPYVGYAFLAVLAGGLAWLCGRLMGGWRYRPRTLRCPDVGDLDQAETPALRRHAAYICKYLLRLGVNESLSPPRRDQARRGAEALAAGCRRRVTPPDELAALIRTAEAQHVEPLLDDLDALAEQEIGTCVRDVMVAVAASPWPLVDALIVLYRNGSMVCRVTHIYNSRPALREQLAIFTDTVRIVATIKLAHMMRKVLERTLRDVPLAGRIAEALTQAVGAGVLTSAAGHAAKHRCRAFRGWDRDEAARDLKAQLGNFLADCWHVASDTLLGPLGRLCHRSAGAVAAAFKSALDAAAAAADTFVRKPVAAGGRSVAATVRRTARKWLRRRGDELPPASE
jgi:uncharacterized membrane protein YcjF (UPF0283 family)